MLFKVKKPSPTDSREDIKKGERNYEKKIFGNGMYVSYVDVSGSLRLCSCC